MSSQLPPEIEKALDNLRQAIAEQLQQAPTSETAIMPGSEAPGPGMPPEAIAAGVSPVPYPGAVGEVPAPVQEVVLPQLAEQVPSDLSMANDNGLPYPQMPVAAPGPVTAATDSSSPAINPFAIADPPLTAAPVNPEVLNVPETSPPTVASNNYQVFEQAQTESMPTPDRPADSQSFTKARSLLSNVLQKQGGGAA